MKKLISELTREELVKVFNGNEKLRTSVYDDFVEGEMSWIGDHIDYIKDSLNDWNIGTYNRNYLKISDCREFLNGVEQIQKDFCLLSEDEEDLLSKAVNVADTHYESEMYSDEYYQLENEMEDLSNKVAQKLINHWESNLNCSKETLEDYFVEFYSEERMIDEDYFVDTDSYELFEEVHFIKSYK